MPLNTHLRKLPGADLIAAGVEDLRQGVYSIHALLVLIGARRLRDAGLEVPRPRDMPDHPELKLYAALCEQGYEDAHARYNAYLRRLVSFERALERLQARQLGDFRAGLDIAS